MGQAPRWINRNVLVQTTADRSGADEGPVILVQGLPESYLIDGFVQVRGAGARLYFGDDPDNYLEAVDGTVFSARGLPLHKMRADYDTTQPTITIVGWATGELAVALFGSLLMYRQSYPGG